MLRRGILLAGLCAMAATVPATASAAIAGPWSGQNPFKCANQDVGTGTDYPDPGADPFCVEFDKTHQSLLPSAGIVDFLLREPARTAAAAPKCFYFQRDHWTGWVVDGRKPELWHWDGHYFFDKARGWGGVSVRHFRLAGLPLDFSPFGSPYAYPGGGGGVIVLLRTSPDPKCAAMVDTAAERRTVYRAWYRNR